MNLQLNDNIDIENLKALFKETKNIVIEDFLSEESAINLYKYFTQKMPEDWWATSFRASGSKDYSGTTTIRRFKKNLAKIESQYPMLYKALSNGQFAYIFDRSTKHVKGCNCPKCQYERFISSKAVLKIASAIEDEARLLYFKESDNKNYTQTKEWLKTKNNYRHKRKVFQYAMNRHQLEYSGWSKEEKVKLGKLLLELLAKTTGFIKLTKTFAVKGKSIVYVQATDKTMNWIEQKKIHAEILKPFREPMLVKPKRWDNNPYSGGYYIKDLRPNELSTTIGEPTKQNQQSNNEVKDAL